MYLELVRYTRKSRKKGMRIVDEQQQKITKHQNAEKKEVKKSESTGRTHRFVQSKPKAVTMLFCGPSYRKKGADMQMSELKKRKKEWISRISSAVKCTHNDKQEERVHVHTVIGVF